MLGSLLLRETILRVLRPEFGFTARDVGLILTVTGVASLVGFVARVFAIRRMIASAEAAESLELSAGDGE
ncbi:MAG: hypothetical protein O3B04_10095 [Chloroflexi bacterium]|nr:hypothetical protein [Chloroflexota bacterium]